MTEELPTGWVRPVAKPTIASQREKVAQLRAELQEAQRVLDDLEETSRLEAIVKIRNIMRGQGLSFHDLRNIVRCDGDQLP